MRKHTFAIILSALCAILSATAQTLSPIVWDVTVENNTESEATLRYSAKIEKGWHLYGFTLPKDGPNATTINLDLPEGLTASAITPSRAPLEKYDEIFALKLNWWDSDVAFTQTIAIADGKSHELSGTIRFQGCNDKTCISPQKIPFNVTVGTGAPAPVVETPEVEETPVAKPGNQAHADATDWWAPVEIEESDLPVSPADGNSSLWVIFLWGFGGGLLALLTPCVWPMIPMTVSFFLKKSGNRRKSIGDALIYGISIIVIYLSLGLAITAIFGAGKLNELSTNAWFNLAFFLLLVIFAISFFGGFDITLPSKWSNSVDARAERATGLISIFFMAFTLALVSHQASSRHAYCSHHP